MTIMPQARLEILRQRLMDLGTMKERHNSLSELRRQSLQIAREYPEFVIWAPAVCGGRLSALIWEWVEGGKRESIVEIPVPNSWYEWERGKEKPLAL